MPKSTAPEAIFLLQLCRLLEVIIFLGVKPDAEKNEKKKIIQFDWILVFYAKINNSFPQLSWYQSTKKTVHWKRLSGVVCQNRTKLDCRVQL